MKKILIVDDSPAEIKLMEAVLSRAGYWLVSINDPMRLEQAVEVERPNLILMDVVMPGRNGFQACRELKGHAEFGRIPVVLVSSKSTDSDKFGAAARRRRICGEALQAGRTFGARCEVYRCVTTHG